MLNARAKRFGKLDLEDIKEQPEEYLASVTVRDGVQEE